MKISFKCFMLLIFNYCLTSDAQPANFYKEFSTNPVELSLISLDTVHDGGYILVGSYENINGGNAIIIKTDSLGNELWRNTNSYFTSFDSTNSYLSVKECVDKGFILAGYIRVLDSVGAFNSQYLISKIDSLGSVVWEKIVGDTNMNVCNDICIDSDTSFYISGIKYSNFQSESTLEKYNMSGDLLWSNSYSFSSYRLSSTDLIRNGDTLAMTCTLFDSPNFVYKSSILLTDLAGNLLDSVIFPNTFSVTPLSISKASIGSYYYMEKVGGSINKTLLYNLNPDLTVSSLDTLAPVEKAIVDSSLNIYTTGFSTGFTTFKIDATQDTVWSNLLNEEYLMTNYISSKDGCALICGRKDQDNTTISLGFFLRVCDTTIINQIINSPAKVNNLVIVYSDVEQISIILNDDIINKPKKSLSVLDMNGKVVTTINDLSEKTIYLKSYLFKPGLYSVIVRSSNEIIATKNFITK